MNKSILKNISGNFYGVGVNMLNQLLLVPFYIHYWGVDLYGDWIALSAISSFFSMSDIGLNTVTCNRFSIAYHQDNHEECKSLVANNAILILIVSVISIVALLFLMISCDMSSMMNLRCTNSLVASIVVLLLVLRIFFSMYNNIYSSIFRANSKAYISFYVGNTVRLADSLIILVGVICHVDIWIISLLCLIPCIIQFIYYKSESYSKYGFTIDLSACNKRLFFDLLKPSVSFMSFPMGYAIILQGFTLIVNKYFGASEVVLFNTTRTMCNFIKVIPNALKNSVWPEFTIAYAQKNYLQMRALHKKTLLSAISVVVVVSTFIILVGKDIYSLWTRHAVEFDVSLMLLFLITVLFNTIWESSCMTLMATNKHSKIGIRFVVLSVVSLVISFFLAVSKFSLSYNVCAMIFVDVFMAVFVLLSSYRLLYKQYD